MATRRFHTLSDPFFTSTDAVSFALVKLPWFSITEMLLQYTGSELKDHIKGEMVNENSKNVKPGLRFEVWGSFSFSFNDAVSTMNEK